MITEEYAAVFLCFKRQYYVNIWTRSDSVTSGSTITLAFSELNGVSELRNRGIIGKYNENLRFSRLYLGNDARWGYCETLICRLFTTFGRLPMDQFDDVPKFSCCLFMKLNCKLTESQVLNLDLLCHYASASTAELDNRITLINKKSVLSQRNRACHPCVIFFDM